MGEHAYNEDTMQLDISELQGWAREGGELARGLFRRATARRKADRSWVTEADEQVEQLLVPRLEQRYPECGIIGEEQTRNTLDREYVWAIDPIDGTASFVAGLPVWGVSIGLLRHGMPYMGVFYMPIPDELYWCEPGGPAFFNGTRVQALNDPTWDSEDWITVPSNTHRRYAIDFIGKARSLGSSVADCCYVARGSAMGALITQCSIWDLAAGLAILGAAGGSYTGISGRAPDLPAMTLDGSKLTEPLVAAGPANLEPLRSRISVRPR
jgi:myo-inositol-1(or 4)-monophosphatase